MMMMTTLRKTGTRIQSKTQEKNLTIIPLTKVSVQMTRTNSRWAQRYASGFKSPSLHKCLSLQDNHHEVYGTQRVKTMKILPATAASITNKKRKTAESGVDKRPPATVRRKI